MQQISLEKNEVIPILGRLTREIEILSSGMGYSRYLGGAYEMERMFPSVSKIFLVDCFSSKKRGENVSGATGIRQTRLA